MRAAGAEVCGGFEIGVDEDQKLIGGARYRDKRPVAMSMWATVMEALRGDRRAAEGGHGMRREVAHTIGIQLVRALWRMADQLDRRAARLFLVVDRWR